MRIHCKSPTVQCSEVCVSSEAQTERQIHIHAQMYTLTRLFWFTLFNLGMEIDRWTAHVLNFGHILHCGLNLPALSFFHIISRTFFNPWMSASFHYKPLWSHILHVCLCVYVFGSMRVHMHCDVSLASVHLLTWLFTLLRSTNEYEAGCDRPHTSTMHYLANGQVADAGVHALRPASQWAKAFRLAPPFTSFFL